MPGVERARPWLGTIVSIRAEAASAELARAAIEQAFAMVGHVHRCMSFQSDDSDLAAIGRLPAGGTAEVDGDTVACLAAALALAAASDGAFDPVLPGSGADWHDLALAGTAVTVRRPLQLDLSGIAKGHAVDRACDCLRAHGATAGLVNAGGDLRLFGSDGETIALTPRHHAPPAAIHLRDGALASSDAAGSHAEYGGSQHRDGRTGTPVSESFVSVVAPSCRDADALTKVVLALGLAAAPLLARYQARAYGHDLQRGWWAVGNAT